MDIVQSIRNFVFQLPKIIVTFDRDKCFISETVPWEVVSVIK